ncbi:unnamed protein product [Amaranthus hypochondriacus]
MFSRVRKPSERGLGCFCSNFQKRNGSFLKKRNVWLEDSNSHQQLPSLFTGGSNYHHHTWSSPTSAGGHRGFAHPSRRWVPREPPRSNHGSTTLFVDSLPVGTSRDWVHGFFSGIGKVVDVYVSRKPRKNYNLAFGFVRFQWREDALAAIDSLHGSKIKNCEIKVSLAKYPKIVSSLETQNHKRPRVRVFTSNKRGIKIFKFRDNRNYAEVLKGVRRQQLEGNSEKVSPVLSPVKMDENTEIKEQPTVSVESNEKEAVVVDYSPSKLDGDSEAVVEGSHVPLEHMERCTTHDVSGDRIERTHLEVINPGSSALSKVPFKGKRIQNQKAIAMFLGYYSNSTDEVTKKLCAT